MKRNVFTILLICSCCLLIGCEKDLKIESVKHEGEFSLLCFSSPEELSQYAELVSKTSEFTTTTETRSSNFVSLWDSQVETMLSSLSEEEIRSAMAEDLVYEPEDKIIQDPVFAKILNHKREIMVAGEIYRYVETGVIIYRPSADQATIEKIIPEDYGSLQDREEIMLSEDIRFVRLCYLMLDSMGFQTKASTGGGIVYPNKLVLKDGTEIPKNDIHVVQFEKGSGDANNFQKELSALFGQNVVAENYFSSSRRMKVRTFAQNFYFFTSVGMTVRMQQKQAGIWWRKKAQEFRYGWTAVECYYTYEESSLPSGMSFQTIPIMLHNYSAFYKKKPLVLFSIPVAEYKAIDTDILSKLNRLLQKYDRKIKEWMNQHPEYKNNPYSIFSADQKTGYSMIFPMHEEPAENEGREKINWDFRTHFSVGFQLNGNNIKPTFEFSSDPKKIEIRQGEIYAAVKYGDVWKACVITTR